MAWAEVHFRTKWRLHSSSIQPFCHNTHEPKTGGFAPFRGELRLHVTQRRLGYLDPCSRLATTDMDQKLGESECAFYLGIVGSHRTKSPGPRPTSIPSGILVHPAVWPQLTLAENWGCSLFRGGGAGSPSNTMSSRLRPTSIPSGILMHPALWPK